jgi:chromosomal replication initiator protein
MKQTLSQQEFYAWIDPLKSEFASETEILVIVPNMVFYQGLMDNYLDKIEQAKTSLGIEPILIRFETSAPMIEKSVPHMNVSETPSFKAEAQISQTKTEQKEIVTQEYEKSSSGPLRSLSSKSNLNPNYIFENFVKGPSNQFAHASCSAVADAPGKTYNPLFIYGCTGLGKTHLLHAVGNHILRNQPDANVIYISSERFMNEMIYCLRFNKMWEFRQKYRHCDAFLVDDIQFISKKDHTQEEFFHTFNALYEARKQIVITSDMFPQDIPDIEDRLRNRFQWGLIADIQPPDTEHRMAILYSKAEKLGIQLADDVALYIANHAKRNVRELEGALHRITAFSALHGRQINLDLAMETFQNVLGDAPKRMTIETVQKAVADHYKIRISDLKSKKRQRALTLPRQVAMYLSRSLTNASFPELGERFGGKDHTTVMHAVRKIDKDRSRDLDLKAHIETLERQLEQLT